MEETRIFPLGRNMTLGDIALLLEQYLNIQKHLTTQKFSIEKRIFIQCADRDSDWKQLIGLDAALTVELKEENHTLSVTIGNAKWLDKVGTATVGALFFTPLVVTAGIGAVRQAVLPGEIFSFIEGKTGKTINIKDLFKQAFPNPFNIPNPFDIPGPFNMPNPFDTPISEKPMVCPCCRAKIDKNQIFCSQCGTRLSSK